MTESVSVAVRFRPLSVAELQEEHVRQQALKALKPGPQEVWTVLAAQNLVINNRTNIQYQYGKTHTDQVFDQNASNSEVFALAAKPVVLKSTEGIHGTIFAYGQTSSGKTHTMKGTAEQPGVIPLALAQLFESIRVEQARVFLVKVAYLEVYNETVNDLLDEANTNLEIRENLERGTFVQNLTEKTVSSESEALELLYRGEANRKVGETSMNEQSSRSHTIFKVHVESTPIENSDVAPVRLSYLNLVDLAGSEGVQKTKAEDMRQREGSNINKSLLSLSNVIQKLSEAQGRGVKGYINFRDSKMTRLLQTSLTGNSKTVIICTVTQSIRHMTETTNTLNFGQNAKRIKLTARPNEILSVESQLRQAQEEIRKLCASLEDSEAQVRAKELDLLRMREMHCEQDQYSQDVREKLEEENEELKAQIRKAQEKLDAVSRGIVNSTGKSLLCTPQSTGKTRPTFSPEASIHTLESLVLEKDRKIQALEQNLAHISVTYEDKYQSLLMDNECLRKLVSDAPFSESSQGLDQGREFQWSEKLAELETKLEEQVREREEIEEIAKDYEEQLKTLKLQLAEGSVRDEELAELKQAMRVESEASQKVQALLQAKTREWQIASELLAKVTEELAAVNSRRTQVEAENVMLAEKNKELDQIAEELAAENETLGQDFAEARSTIAELYQQLETMMGENEELHNSLSSTRRENEALAAEVEQISLQLETPVVSDEVKQELQARSREIEELKQKLSCSDALLEEATAAAQAATSRLDALQTKHGDLLAQSAAKDLNQQQEVAALQGRLASLQGQVASLQATVDTQVAELTRLSAATEDVQRNGNYEELMKAREQCAELMEESRGLKAALLEARQSLRKQEDQHTELQCALAALRNADWEARAKRAEEKLQKLEQEVREAATRLALEHSELKREKTRQVHDLQVAVETAEQRTREVEAALAKKEEEVAELNRRLLYKRLPSDLMDERLKQELTSTERYQLNLQVHSGVNKVKELELHLQRLEDKRAKLQHELDQKRALEHSQASRIRELEKKIERLEQEYVELEHRFYSRKSPCELMPRRVERAPVFTPMKSLSQDEEEDVDLGSEMKNQCIQQ